MEVIRNARFDELLAMCGGCSCATCHVYIESSPAYMPREISIGEGKLLEASEYRCPNSRLSCQILCSDIPVGMAVTIAPEDWGGG
jgi:2Fe-2S ferredoxin